MKTGRWIGVVLVVVLLAGAGCEKKRGRDWERDLHHQAEYGHVEQVQRLIALRANVNAVDEEGRTPLHLAAARGHRRTVELLIRCGAHVDPPDSEGRAPVTLALAGDHAVVVEYLVREGAAVDLHVAAYLGDMAQVTRLIRGGADVNAKGFDGWTPLHRAALRDQVETARLLIGAGAAIDAAADHDDYQRGLRGAAALHYAVGRGHAELVRLLLDSGADINAQDKHAVTPLLLAVHSGRADMVRFLIARGADPNVRTDGYHFPRGTALGVVVEEGLADIVELLIAGGADVNAPDGSGLKPLHVAVTSEYESAVAQTPPGGDAPEEDWAAYEHARDEARADLMARMARLLLAAGADVDGRDEAGLTPLHYASFHSDRAAVELLLSHGADINARSAREPNDNDLRWWEWDARLGPGVTPLHEAVVGADPNLVELLIRRGAEVNAEDESGDTPLHYAVVRSSEAVVKLLLARGAEVNTRDNHGATPLVVALRNGSVAAARLLLAAGAERVALKGHPPTLRVEGGDDEAGPLLHRALRFADRSARLKYHRDDEPNFAQYRGEWISLLVEHGVDLEARDGEGETPLHVATGLGDEESAALLLAHGADAEARDRVGVRPLHVAARYRQTGFVALLLSHGADANACADDGDTPLHNAAMRGHREVVEVLLAGGADPSMKNSRNRTPADEAARKQYAEIVQLLTAGQRGDR